MASSQAPNSAVHRTRIKQRGGCVKPEVATVSLARGVFGGDQHARIETEREQLNVGEFPKTLTLCASVRWYHACTWTQTYNCLDLSLNSFSSRPFLLSNSNQYPTHLFLSFLAVQCSYVWIFLFCLRFTLRSDNHVSQVRMPLTNAHVGLIQKKLLSSTSFIL
jgi:hypothetical protein